MNSFIGKTRLFLASIVLVVFSSSSYGATPWLWFGAWTNGTDTNYDVGFGVDDPGQVEYSGVALSGGGVSTVGVFDSAGGFWDSNISFGPTAPSSSVVFDGVLTSKTGSTSTTQFSVRSAGYNLNYPTNIQPTGFVEAANPVFTWSDPVVTGSYNYDVQVRLVSTGAQIWQQRNIAGNSVTYAGPALVPGTVYRLRVRTREYDSTTNATYAATRQQLFCFQCTGSINFSKISVESYKRPTEFYYGVSLVYQRFAGDGLASYLMQCPNGLTNQGAFSAQTSGTKTDWIWFGFGSNQPVTPMDCSSTVTYSDGSTNTKAFVVDHFAVSSDYPSISSPANGENLFADPVVAFSVPNGGNSEVKLWTNSGSYERLWFKWMPQSPVSYDGPALTPGSTYTVQVGSTVGDEYQHTAYTDSIICYKCVDGVAGSVYDQIFVGRNKGPNGSVDNFGVSARLIRSVGDNLISYRMSCANGVSTSGSLSAVSNNVSQWFNLNLGSTQSVTPLACTATVTRSDSTSTSQDFSVDRIPDASRYVTNLSLVSNSNVNSLSNVTFTAPALDIGERVESSIRRVNADGSWGDSIWYLNPTASPINFSSLPALTANTQYILGIAVVDGTTTMHAAQTFVSFCYQCTGTGGTSGGTLALTSGWNLVGNSSNSSVDVSVAFGDPAKSISIWKWITVRNVWAFYAPSMTSSALATYAQSKGYDVLTTISPGDGVWVNAKVPFTVNVSTSNPVYASDFAEGQALALNAGWSLIAIGETKTPREFANAISPTPPSTNAIVSTTFTSLWAWDTTSSSWLFYAPSLDNSGTLSSYTVSKSYVDFGTTGTVSLGKGFWVNK